MEFVFVCSWTEGTLISSKKIISFISVPVDLKSLIPNLNLTDASLKRFCRMLLRYFSGTKNELKIAILNKTLTRINTGHPDLSEHIGKSLLTFSQKAVLSCDTLG